MPRNAVTHTNQSIPPLDPMFLPTESSVNPKPIGERPPAGQS